VIWTNAFVLIYLRFNIFYKMGCLEEEAVSKGLYRSNPWLVFHLPSLNDGFYNATATKIFLLPRPPLPPRVSGFLFAFHSHRFLLVCSLAPSLPSLGKIIERS
jgi:hypothetical protein